MKKESSKKGEELYSSVLKKLIILELVICIIAITVGYMVHNMYFRGVGIGLLISWVTGALAYYITKTRNR